MLMIRIRMENSAEKLFLKDGMFFALLLSGSGKPRVEQQSTFWVMYVAIVACKAFGRPLCCC